MIAIYKSISKYKFKHESIEENFENKKEYYYLGFQSIDYYITKIVYSYLIKFNQKISFCCDFTLLQKIVKRISSKEYFKQHFSLEEKYVYSFIGAVISDDVSFAEDVINEIYKIEDYLLTIFKKEENKFILVNKYLLKRKSDITTTFTHTDKVGCTCYVSCLNRYFTNYSSTILEAKYIVLEEIYTYLIENNLYYDIDEIIGEYNVSNACETLELLYKHGFIDEPIYNVIVHDEFESCKYEVRCNVSGLSYYSIKIHDNEEEAKNQSAFSMVEMIVLQNRT